MVETITPVVYGGRARWGIALALHSIGATATAAAFGAALGLVGGLLEAPWGRAGALALAAVAAVYAIGELPRVTATVPQLRRQVPDWWRTFFGWPVAATLYGAGLGVGFLTYLAHGTLVAVSFAALASGDPLVGAIVVGPFGLARGLSAVTAARVRTQPDSQRLVERLASSSERRRSIANGAVLVIVAALALAEASVGDDGWAAFATAALALTFGWAALSKVARRRTWRHALGAHGLPRGVESFARWAVPASEALVAGLVVLGLPRAGGIWALALLLVFTAASVRAWRRFGPQVPCDCFGGRDAVSLPTLLLRNAALAALAVVIAGRSGVSGAMLPGAPGPGESVPMVLAIGGLAMAGFTAWTTIRWLGRYERA
ncbi:MAG: MauE/DoxX family redox-associated membrane protein [Actinomycetota bacterium]